ncbi:MAG TPA: hypothetical protein PKD37_05640 [Oligoflexia bacterium]|nr:hypothetical protein [Oligoflexia bacterium]HMP27446.1 hypothetical protein [Oligoflexia bacterium]
MNQKDRFRNKLTNQSQKSDKRPFTLKTLNKNSLKALPFFIPGTLLVIAGLLTPIYPATLPFIFGCLLTYIGVGVLWAASRIVKAYSLFNSLVQSVSAQMIFKQTTTPLGGQKNNELSASKLTVIQGGIKDQANLKTISDIDSRLLEEILGGDLLFEGRERKNGQKKIIIH